MCWARAGYYLYHCTRAHSLLRPVQVYTEISAEKKHAERVMREIGRDVGREVRCARRQQLDRRDDAVQCAQTGPARPLRGDVCCGLHVVCVLYGAVRVP
jgi:hypothetical protein